MDEESPHVQESIDTVAKFIVWRLIDTDRVLWEDYPEIGEVDFERVLDAVERLIPERPLDYEESYKYLAWRAL